MTEQKAIEGCKRQDRISQKYLFDAWSDGMLMLCMRYVKSLPDAEELMLNGFYNFFRTIDRFVYNGTGSLVAWLKKIMVNECLMFLRKKDGLKIVNGEYAAEAGADNGQLEKMAAAEIYKLIVALPAGYSTVFNLFVIEGYGHKEIAGMLGITRQALNNRVNKGK